MNWQDDDSVLRAECARLQAENTALRSALTVAEKMIFRYREALRPLHTRLAEAERVVSTQATSAVRRRDVSK